MVDVSNDAILFHKAIIKGRFHFLIVTEKPRRASGCHAFTVNAESLYEPFAEDFGPPSLAKIYKFCKLVDQKLKKLHDKVIYFYSDHEELTHRTNIVFLVGAYCILCRNQTPDVVFASFKCLEDDGHLVGFRDAAPGEATHRLSLLDCFSAIYKAMKLKFIDLKTFNCREYEELEQPVNGDMNWIIPGKLLAFASPTDQTKELNPEDDGRGETITHPPSRFISDFKRWGITAVVRLNFPNEYDRNAFIQAGIEHHDLYFVDGTHPPKAILDRFLNIAETSSGAIAVHCKAGLGRTGTLNGCYIMKHYGLTAREVIAFTRVMRPGSIIGPQQHFLEEWERKYLPKIRPAVAEEVSDASSSDAGSDKMDVDEEDGVPVAADPDLDSSSSSNHSKKRERAPTQPRKFTKSAADDASIPDHLVSSTFASTTSAANTLDKRRKLSERPI